MPVKHSKTMCNSQSEQNYVRSKDFFLTKWDAHFVKGEMVHVLQSHLLKPPGVGRRRGMARHVGEIRQLKKGW